ncbi:MAG: 3-phosphoshikimate 1-carboxyvinyltransferase [Pyrinomonadaceae bacterium]|nr:3-phosphoshikimate 1-carboxyvinyltransferase [Pyrinomonadaceae bacterium]
MKIEPANFLNGKIRLPGDKSISHRAAIFAALATGDTRIENYATNADCASTLNCLENLGVEIRREDSTIFIKGVGKNGFTKPNKPLDCGNSGTTMRLLAGVLAGQNFDSVLTGDASLSKRPMRRIIEPLELMGAKIEAEDNHAPLKIYGRNPLQAISYDLPVASAQVKSCVLLAGLNAAGKSIVLNPNSIFQTPNSRNHTELMLKYLGAAIEEKFVETGGGFVEEILIDGNSKLEAKNLSVPSDISSAAFFIVGAACLENSEIVLENVGLNPTRTAILEILQRFGADLEILNQKEVGNEIGGDLRVRGRRKLSANTDSNLVSGDIIANLIDEIPVLAVFGTQFENGLEIRGAGELRVKESDRIAAVVENLRRMNAAVEEFPDGFRVGKSDLKGAEIDSFGDHRIAMAFAIAALLADGATAISGAEHAGVSFPEFFQTLEYLKK